MRPVPGTEGRAGWPPRRCRRVLFPPGTPCGSKGALSAPFPPDPGASTVRDGRLPDGEERVQKPFSDLFRLLWKAAANLIRENASRPREATGLKERKDDKTST